MTPGEAARRFVRAQHYGVLSTISKKLDGYPFGSIVPYVLDQEARPVILISTLAEHTKNIASDHRVSLLVHEPSSDVQASARITLVGSSFCLADQAAIKPRYLRYFPQAATYFDTHDFFFYRIDPTHIRFIAGIGNIHWVQGIQYQAPQNRLAEQEADIINHMNQDHSDNLRQYCMNYHNLEALDVAMLGIDCDGFDVRADEQVLRFEFDEPVVDASGARKALVTMARKSRK